MVIKKLFGKDEPDSHPFLVVGLGNPGREYEDNRHNVGFMLADRLAERLGVEFTRVQANSLVTKGQHENQRLILAKPRTYMNRSGQSVAALVRFYKLPLAHLLVAHDDVDLPLETIRLKPEGGSAGHKGMQSIIERLGRQDFPRLRIGIGRPKGRMDTPDYVLQDFSKGEQDVLPFVLDRAADAALAFVTQGIQHAMTEYNRLEP